MTTDPAAQPADAMLTEAPITDSVAFDYQEEGDKELVWAKDMQKMERELRSLRTRPDAKPESCQHSPRTERATLTIEYQGKKDVKVVHAGTCACIEREANSLREQLPAQATQQAGGGDTVATVNGYDRVGNLTATVTKGCAPHAGTKLYAHTPPPADGLRRGMEMATEQAADLCEKNAGGIKDNNYGMACFDCAEIIRSHFAGCDSIATSPSPSPYADGLRKGMEMAADMLKQRSIKMGREFGDSVVPATYAAAYEYIRAAAAKLAPSDAHPEDYCQKCGRENITWFAPNELWNKYSGDGESGILCPCCFVKAAEEIKSAWKLVPEFYEEATTANLPKGNV